MLCKVCVCLSVCIFFYLQVSGAAPPKPSTSFAHFGFDEQLMNQIRKSEYTQPTPIQCQVTQESTGVLRDSYTFLLHRMCNVKGNTKRLCVLLRVSP